MLFVTGYGQTSLRKSSLSAGGGSATVGNTYMVYALGEIGTNEADQGNMHLSEGFVGPDFAALLGIEDYSRLEGVKIFPNPVRDILKIKTDDYGTYEIHLFDITGKEVTSQNITDSNYGQVQVGHLKTGYYLFSIIDREHKKSLTIKLQKL